MTNTEYSDLALRTAPGAENVEITATQKQLILMALGLTGEAGEVAEMVKKHVFHGHPMDDGKVLKLLKELGDVLWYINYGATTYARMPSIETVMHMNIEKLEARYPEGFFSAERSMHRAARDE